MPKNLKRGVALAVLACIGSPNVSFAQESVIEEIVVTATKRSQTLQETPVAVSVTTAETIEQAQILDVSDLQSVVPSLRITQLQNSTNTNFVIRGFGNGANNPGVEPSVGVFVDGVYRSRSAGAIGDLPTLERVEVLHGPQSTLFGKNASAGVISVVTAKPTGEFGGKVGATFANRDGVVLKGEVEGAITDTIAYKVSGGINQKDGYVTNQVTGNDINNRDRYNVRGDLLFTPNDNLEIRVIADFDNIDEECCATVNLFAGPTLAAIQGTVPFTNESISGELVPNDPDARIQSTSIDPTNQQDNYGISTQVDYDFGNVAFTSITSYREIDTFANIDADFTSADLITNDIQTDIETFTQEFRLTGTSEKFDWQVGAFYFNEDIQTENNLPFGSEFRPFVNGLVALGGISGAIEELVIAGLDPNDPANLGALQTGALTALGGFNAVEAATGGPFFAEGPGVSEVGTLENESLSLFGQFDYHINDRLTASLGLNWTIDEKDATIVQTSNDVFSSLDLVQVGFGGIFQDQTGLAPTPENIATFAQANPAAFAAFNAAANDPDTNPALALSALQFLPPLVDLNAGDVDSSTEDRELTYTLKLAYDFSDSLSGYVSYGTGFKASSFNLSRDSRVGQRFADPEEASVLEFGLKGTFPRGSFNVAIFDQSLEDFQSNTFIGTAFALVNAEEQSVYGAEFDITYYPIDALKLTLAATLLEPEFDSFTNGPIPVLNAGDTSTGDLSGQQPAGIHEASFSLAATYSFNIGNNDAFIRGDFYFEDEVQVTDNVPFGDVTFATGQTAFIDGSRETKNLNLAAGITTPSGYNLSIWARNVTDHDTLISTFPGIAQTGTFNGYRNEPRTYGISFGKEF